MHSSIPDPALVVLEFGHVLQFPFEIDYFEALTRSTRPLSSTVTRTTRWIERPSLVAIVRRAVTIYLPPTGAASLEQLMPAISGNFCSTALRADSITLCGAAILVILHDWVTLRRSIAH